MSDELRFTRVRPGDRITSQLIDEINSAVDKIKSKISTTHQITQINQCTTTNACIQCTNSCDNCLNEVSVQCNNSCIQCTNSCDQCTNACTQCMNSCAQCNNNVVNCDYECHSSRYDYNCGRECRGSKVSQCTSRGNSN